MKHYLNPEFPIELQLIDPLQFDRWSWLRILIVLTLILSVFPGLLILAQLMSDSQEKQHNATIVGSGMVLFLLMIYFKIPKLKKTIITFNGDKIKVSQENNASKDFGFTNKDLSLATKRKFGRLVINNEFSQCFQLPSLTKFNLNHEHSRQFCSAITQKLQTLEPRLSSLELMLPFTDGLRNDFYFVVLDGKVQLFVLFSNGNDYLSSWTIPLELPLKISVCEWPQTNDPILLWNLRSTY